MPRHRWRRAGGALALGLVVLGVGASPGLAAAKPGPPLSYAPIATPKYESLCVGQTVEFDVSINRTTQVNGQRYSAWVTGGYVLGVIDDAQVGSFEPSDAGRAVAPGPGRWATFVFRAAAPGQTKIEFNITKTGEEGRVGSGYPTTTDTVTVDVTSCWEAYTSGLGTRFIEDKMGDLTEPFLLAGTTPNVYGVDTESQFMFFLPSPRDPSYGSYAFIDTAWPTSGPAGRCTAYVSGRYDVLFYGDPKDPLEGDLLLKGTGVNVCPRVAIPIDYSSHTGFQIAFLRQGP